MKFSTLHKIGQNDVNLFYESKKEFFEITVSFVMTSVKKMFLLFLCVKTNRSSRSYILIKIEK